MKQGSTPYVKRLPKSAVMRPLMYGLAGALLSGGTFVFSSHPFGIALAAAAGGFSGAASAVCGALIGCLRLDDGTVFAAAISAVFIFRLIIGRWLNPPEHREETPAGSKGERLIFRLRRYAVEASEVSFHESKLIRMIVSAAASVAAGGVISASDGYRIESIVSTVAAAVISPTLVYLYSGIGDTSRSRTLSEAGRCAVAASAVVSLTGLVPYIDIAPAAAFVIVLLASRSSGTLV